MYSLLDANENSRWFAPAGTEQLLRDLPKLKAGRWAVTGHVAASAHIAVDARGFVAIYADDIERLAKVARLVPASKDANVILAEPYDAIVFDRLDTGGSFPTVSPSQVVIDALDGPTATHAVGEVFLSWMRRNESAWRSTSLRVC